MGVIEVHARYLYRIAFMDIDTNQARQSHGLPMPQSSDAFVYAQHARKCLLVANFARQLGCIDPLRPCDSDREVST